MTFDELLAQQRPHVERAIQDLARRHYLASTEVEEFRHAVERALERNDYELLRAFDGRCTWPTYLTTVITREFFLFQAAMWGPWRPSAVAVRLGPAAMLLEELVVRDRFPLNDAIEWMRATHRVDVPRHRLMQSAEQLGLGSAPARKAAPSFASDGRIRAALADALALVTPDDRLILELRFRDRQPLTRIAAILKIDARPLQRRIDTATDVIRQALLTQGIEVCEVDAVFHCEGSEAPSAPQKWWSLVTRPS